MIAGRITEIKGHTGENRFKSLDYKNYYRLL